MKRLTGNWRIRVNNFAVSIEVEERDGDHHYWRDANGNDLWARVRNEHKLTWRCVK
ncbi:hypothetical protein [Motilimonas pumila]|uniref:hypothetical protein n=1 Tax=Motilimonas pumila TaxID=2303987 RepID=UPI0013143318|nr:hypothetical protein [Motilimonas pumila]